MQNIDPLRQRDFAELQHRELVPDDYDVLRLLDDESNNIQTTDGYSFSIFGIDFYNQSTNGYLTRKAPQKELKKSWRTFKISSEKHKCYNNRCQICLLNLQKGQIGVELPCVKAHYFHKRCLEKWYNFSNRCPLDNQNMDDI